MANRFTKYTKNYIDSCFSIWYASGRKSFESLYDEIPTDEHGRKASYKLLGEWRAKYIWDAIADDLDSKAVTLASDVENGLVQRKADMLLRQAEIGFKLQEKGWEYLDSHSFDTAASAVQAIKLGVELERSSRGISDLLIKMSNMTDTELEKYILNQLERATGAGQIIDGQEVGEEELIGESSDEETPNSE